MFLGVEFMDQVEEHIDKLNQELKRGTITLGVLSQLHERQYGYSLVTILQNKGLYVEPGTLYPLLRRLEKQGLLDSEWDTSESRPRKYYYLNNTGKLVLNSLQNEWVQLVTSMKDLLEGDIQDGND